MVSDKRKRNHGGSAVNWQGIGIGAGLATGLLAAVLWQRNRTRKDMVSPEGERGHRAALVAGDVEPGNIDQTRPAGPDAIRSEVDRPWDRVDEASDESFPSSDPPAFQR